MFIPINKEMRYNRRLLRKTLDSLQLTSEGSNSLHVGANSLKQATIVILFSLQYPAIRWLHSVLGHAGSTRLHATIKSHFGFPNMMQAIITFGKQCSFCQKYNEQIQKYGHVPPKKVLHLHPCNEIMV